MSNVGSKYRTLAPNSVRLALAVAFHLPILFGQTTPAPVARSANHAPMADAQPEGQVVRQLLFRPADFWGLKDYVEKVMEGRFNPSTLQSRSNADGYPEIGFSHFEKGMLSEVTIVDRGHLLEYKSVTNPAFGPGLRTPVETDTLATGAVSKAQATGSTQTCGGLSSTGNPYGCCGIAPNDGNCTFAAWELAKRSWGFSLPPWGNAGTWYDSARSATPPFPRRLPLRSSRSQ